MSELRRVVIDTSTLVGAVLRPASPPRQALLVAAKGFELCVSTSTLHELEEVLQRPKVLAETPKTTSFWLWHWTAKRSPSCPVIPTY